ncbi:MAG: hypothetical protein O2779_02685 [Nanoarchaeota archaeon]|nr:hypothetical protein [Nanoarchaeota archaeon]
MKETRITPEEYLLADYSNPGYLTKALSIFPTLRRLCNDSTTGQKINNTKVGIRLEYWVDASWHGMLEKVKEKIENALPPALEFIAIVY